MSEILLYCYRRFGQLTGLHIRLIIPGVHVVSEGSGAPVPDTAELQKRMQELNEEAEPKGWKYLCIRQHILTVYAYCGESENHKITIKRTAIPVLSCRNGCFFLQRDYIHALAASL